jgi:hypothetical protein
MMKKVDYATDVEGRTKSFVLVQMILTALTTSGTMDSSLPVTSFNGRTWKGFELTS